jgi:DNA-binding GntR family transcriptional regulator
MIDAEDPVLTLPKLSAATQTRQRAVHGIIENEILELRIPPGSRLVEAELAANFGISKTPIREAFLILERQSLIELVPYAGARVNMLSLAEYINIVSLMDQVEIPALEAVVQNVTPYDLARMLELSSQLDAAFRSRDGSAYRRLVGELHHAMFTPAKNSHLDKVLEHLMMVGRRYAAAVTHKFDDTWQLEYDLIRSRLNAIERRDSTVARDVALTAHDELTERFRELIKQPDIGQYFTD